MFTDKCKKFFDFEVFSFQLYLIQMIKKKEEHAFFLAYLITNLTKVKNPSTQKEICKKKKNFFFCFKIGQNANSSTWDCKCKNCNGKHNTSISTFSKNALESRFDNLSNSSANNLANNQTKVLLQTIFVKVGDLHLEK